MAAIMDVLAMMLLGVTLSILVINTYVYLTAAEDPYTASRLPTFYTIFSDLMHPLELAYLFTVGILVTYYPSTWTITLTVLVVLTIIYSCILGHLVQYRNNKQ